MSEREFAGFASGEAVAPLPASLLRDAAPRMTDAAELLVTLYAVEALSRVRKFPRCLALSDLRGARPLVEALSGICGEREVAESFADGLRAAAARGTLLHERAQTGPAGNRAWGEWIALNSAEGRRALVSLGDRRWLRSRRRRVRRRGRGMWRGCGGRRSGRKRRAFCGKR